MSETTIPGICAKHKIVSGACVDTHGAGGALAIAFGEIRHEAEACLSTSNIAAGVKLHIVLTVERT